ncbi:MAG TPA: hypothetical protein VHO06_15195 [Polyangia bacterium]|nr:hypothetical protein [Polyangia bacterium]
MGVEGGRSHLNWAALLGGTGTSLGVWITLTALGFAIGLVAISPHSPNLKGVIVWLGVWAGIVPIIATAVGSLVAGWAANAVRAATGVLYGIAVWGLSLAVAVLFSVSVMGGVAERAVQASAQVATGAVTATVGGVTRLAGAAGGANGDLLQSVGKYLDVNGNELLAPVNRRLQAEGVPPVTTAELQAAVQDVAQTALREGNLSQQTIVAALAQHTRMNQAEAQRVAQQLEGQLNQASGGALGAVTQAWTSTREAVLGELRAAGGAFWWMFGSFCVSLLASIGAGVWGSRLYRPRPRRVVRERAPQAPVVVGPHAHQPT